MTVYKLQRPLIGTKALTSGGGGGDEWGDVGRNGERHGYGVHGGALGLCLWRDDLCEPGDRDRFKLCAGRCAGDGGGPVVSIWQPGREQDRAIEWRPGIGC